MLRGLFITLFLIILVSFLSCGDSLKMKELKVENVVIGVEDPENGTIVQVDTAIFKPGESVCIILINVSGFKKNEGGMNRFDMDVEIVNPDGKIVYSEKEVLGFKGWRNLKDNIATTPTALFTIGSSYPSGIYTFKVTIYDKVGKGSATVSETFEVVEGSNS